MPGRSSARLDAARVTLAEVHRARVPRGRRRTRSWCTARRPTIPHSGHGSGGWPPGPAAGSSSRDGSSSSDRVLVQCRVLVPWRHRRPRRRLHPAPRTAADLRAFVEAASADAPGALANHHYSADILAIARAGRGARETFRQTSRPTTRCRAGWRRSPASRLLDLRARRRLAMDVDSPLDLLLLQGGAWGAAVLPLPGDPEAGPVRARPRRALRGSQSRDPGAELLISGRTSATDLRWAERKHAFPDSSLRRGAWPQDCLGSGPPSDRPTTAPPGPPRGAAGPRRAWVDRPPRRRALGTGPLVDSRVLLAHRPGR